MSVVAIPKKLQPFAAFLSLVVAFFQAFLGSCTWKKQQKHDGGFRSGILL